MFQIGAATLRNCQGVSRRRLLQVAGIEALGLSVAGLSAGGGLGGRAAAADTGAASDKSCIFIWLNGGPSQFETFDPKPRANDDVRGPFGAIRTSVPGVEICELLPECARRQDKYAVLRSVSHGNANHNSTAMLTGFDATRESFGAVATKFLGGRAAMPPYIHVGSKVGDGSCEASNIDQVGGGQFGAAFAPLSVRDPTGRRVELPGLSLASDISPSRFEDRQQLLGEVNRLREALLESDEVGRLDVNQRRAVEMLTSTRVRDAFDIGREPERLRARYGAGFFGQACLLARRLVESGARFIQLKWYDCIAFDAWDTHGAELPGMMRLEQQLCPRFDQGFSTLLDDLHERGLLDSTLVVVAGEFGRTPKLNRSGDRDHWPHCFSTVMAGAGVPGGAVIGRSDEQGAYPAERPISPTEFAATIYKLLGIDVGNDLRIRPFTGGALPVTELTGGL